MDATLRLAYATLAFADDAPQSPSGPSQKFIDWTFRAQDVAVTNPTNVPTTVPAGQSKTIFDGTRSLTADGTTEMSVELVSGETDRYRFRFDAGTDPGFRTARGLTLSGSTVTVVVDDNGTATFTLDVGSFAAVQVGDVLWVPDTDEIAAQVLHVGNRGFWTVMAASASTIVATREGDFVAANESTLLTANDQVQAFSSDGVQVGDTFEVLLGFVPSTRRAFPVVAVTNEYVEVETTTPIAAEDTILPTAAGLAVYTSGKRFIFLEVDQESAVRLNLDTSNTQRVSPWVAGDPKATGFFGRTGSTWKLVVVNLSAKPLNVIVLAAE